MNNFILPDVGEGIHEAELVEWQVAVGATVREGDPIAVVNTDKVTVELPSPCDGVVAALPWQPGDIISVGSVLMSFASAEGATVAATGSGAATAAGVPSPAVTPAPTAAGPSIGAPASPAPRVSVAPMAAPSTRRLAWELGVDLTGVVGTGPAGRILRDDVLAAADTSAGAMSAVSSFEPSSGEPQRERLSGVRAVMFRKMASSSAQLATTTSTFRVEVSALETLVRDLAPDAERRGVKLSPLTVVGLCCARLVPLHPRFNARFDETTNDLLIYPTANLGIAVASPAGLVVPVLHDAGAGGLFQFATRLADLTDRARRGALTAADLQGATFSVSSTGGLERCHMLSTQPIIDAPQTALLWFSRVRDEAIVRDGAVVPGRTMVCSLSFDHRYIDGAEATEFINQLTDYLEQPVRILA